MEILLFAAVVLTIPYAVRGYFRLANRSLIRAQEAWPLVERHAHVLCQDKRLNLLVSDMVEVALQHAGDGRLTRSFLVSLVTARRRNPDDRFDEAFKSLNAEQEKQFLHFMVAVLYFDSLTSPLLGGILRKVLYWLATTAADRTAPVNRNAVEPAMSAVGRMCMAS